MPQFSIFGNQVRVDVNLFLIQKYSFDIYVLLVLQSLCIADCIQKWSFTVILKGFCALSTTRRYWLIFYRFKPKSKHSLSIIFNCLKFHLILILIIWSCEGYSYHYCYSTLLRSLRNKYFFFLILNSSD